MKKLYFLIIILFLSITIQSQIKTNQIRVNNKDYHIVNIIGYPITGTYHYDGVSEPTTVLNTNGTGTFQFKDLTTTNISWGIEATEYGAPKFEEGFNSATYTLWYKNNSDDDDKWKAVQFSIHYDKKKMFISGERSKTYNDVDENITVKK